MQPPIDFSSLIQVTLPKLAGKNIGEIITTLLPYIFRIVSFILLFLLVLGGYEILTSQGDPKKVASGNQRILYAVIGFVIMLTSFLLVRTIGRILNIKQIIGIFG
ncbi:MAG: hypothetical protein UT08_C0005G0062 [Candidatus Woesebacteria bacterium GW2011_GWB1_38_8]|uniref:Uncharacterized protein n=1 Tax=Candidatus Woesebacteria bacterium GW2011_GWB1_38_8 TaxID=1618570 RepID=A0A0G0P8J5_9BACT|nr:MAG: hypothetical protein UT08_C0005G0062 [Candidatus Woesebacteria bacterium GW2011_GWB1_38_8]